MTTPGGVPNLPAGGMTLDTMADKLQDMSGNAMKARAAERFPTTFDASTGSSPVSDITPFGILTRIFAEIFSLIANADPADIEGPEDIPPLLTEFIEGIPVVGQFIDVVQAILGQYDGTDQALNAIQDIFAPIRKLMQLIGGISDGFPTIEELTDGWGNIPSITDIVSSITGSAGPLSGLTSFLSGKWASLSTASSNALTGLGRIQNSLNNLWEGLTGGTASADKSESDVKSAAAATSSTASTASSNATSALGNLSSLVSGAGGSTISDVADKITSTATRAQEIVNGIVSSITGQVGSYFTQSAANTALTSQTEAIAAANAAIAEIQAQNNQGNNGGLSVVVDFSTLPDSPHLPADMFSTTYIGGSVGRYGVEDGRAKTLAPPDYNESREVIGEYLLGDTVTDYQRVGAVWTTAPGMSYNNPTPAFLPTPFYGPYYATHTIYVRYKDVNNWVRIRFAANDTAYLECCVNGTVTTLTTKSHTFKPGTIYWHEAGTAGGARIYRVIAGSSVILTYSDTAAATQVGDGFRGGAVGGTMKGAQGAGVPAPIGSLLYFAMQDNSPAGVVGSGARFYRAGNNITQGAGMFVNNALDTVDTKTADILWTPGSNCRVTVSITDWYLVSVGATVAASSNPQVRLYKNGTMVRNGSSGANSSSTTRGDMWIIYLQAGDYINPGINNTGTSLTGTADGTGTYLEITKLGKAMAAA